MKKTTKTLDELAYAVAKELHTPIMAIQDTTDNSRNASEVRYLVYGLQEKAGYTHQQIADYFKMSRESVTRALSKLDGLLKTYQDMRDKESRLFKRDFKMTLKLSYQNADALFNLFNEMVLLSDVCSLDQKLIMLHMGSIYKKLRAKWEGEVKKQYKINITDAEATAYRIYWRDNDIAHCAYEWSIIVNQCNQIDAELNTRILNQHSKLKFLKQ